MEDIAVVQCNYAEGTNVASERARAYVVRLNPGNGHDRIVILARSRSGRWVEKWESAARLTDFRRKVIPPGHPLYERLRPRWLPAADAVLAALRPGVEAA